MQYFLLLLALLFTALTGCNRTAKTAEKTLPDYFQAQPATDTLRFEVTTDMAGNNQDVVADTIPASLLFTQIETSLMNDISFFDNSVEMTVLGRYRFPLTDSLEAYLVDMRQHWFQNQSLFLFDLNKKAFTNRTTVAEFYGGDGGQILTGSWLLDYDGDGDKDLVRREIEHWLDVSGEEPRDTTAEHAVLLLWKNGKFTVTAADTAELVKRYPITSMW